MAFFEAIFEEDWPNPSSYHEKAESQSTNSRVTTNISNVNSSPLATSNTEQENHENSQEDYDIALQSDDTLDKNESEPIAITHATYTNSSTISKITTIEHERNPLSDNEIRVRGPSDEPQVEQRFTTNENPTNDCKINNVSLLNPIFTKLSDQADRDTELIDYFGNKLVLIVNGSLSDSIQIEMAMISTSSQGDYNSVYYFHDLDRKTFTNKLRRKVIDIFEKIGDLYLIKLNQLFVRKDQNYTRRIGDKNSKLFELTRYPSGEEIHVRAKGPTIFAKKYNLMQVRLAIQFFSGNSKTPININDAKKEFIFFSNIIGKGPNIEQLSATNFAKVTITYMTPGGNLISFNDDNEFVAEFQIEFTDNFADKLKSYSKWVEILLFNDKFNSIYRIKTDEGLTNVMYMKITCTRFTIPLTIAKQTLSELKQNPDVRQAMHLPSHAVAYHEGSSNINRVIVSMGLNKFYIQFRLLPGVITSAGEKLLFYPDDPKWQFGEYTECKYLEQSTDINMQETVDRSEQNPTDINLNSK